jgi:hypothetical protein
MVADGCGGMGTACSAPCSAPCISLSVPASNVMLTPAASLAAPLLAYVPVGVLETLDAPPKSLLSA